MYMDMLLIVSFLRYSAGKYLQRFSNYIFCVEILCFPEFLIFEWSHWVNFV